MHTDLRTAADVDAAGHAPTEDAGERDAGATMPVDSILDGARIAALHDLGLLDTGPEEEFDRYTQMATELLSVPVSLVSLIDADRQFFKSHVGLPGEVVDAPPPLSDSYCRHAVASKQPLIISDARVHPLGVDNPVTRDLGVVAYAGIPLVLSDGHAVGSFCAIDAEPRDWSAQDIRVLHNLSSAVQAHLELRKALAERNLHDRLTGLANRTMLCAQAEHLMQAMGPAAANTVVAICIGLDSFTLVNQAYGAVAADGLLRQVGERLAAETRAGDMLGRLGGDTFALVRAGSSDEHEAQRLAGRLRAVVSASPFDVDGQSIGVTASFGLASGAEQDSGGDLLIRSDESLRAGKISGGDGQKAASGSRERAATQLALRAALGGALDRREIHVAYQPIVALDGAAPAGFEALARWNSPELGVVSPGEFIPVAERTGDIVKIGEWVLRAACAQLAGWRRDGGPKLSISVNLAPLQLALPNIAQIVQAALTDHRLPASALTLEITEGVLIGAGTLQTRNLDRLRELGVKIALDDFGTGYSSLSYLTRFPIDQIKIDRSFVDRLEDEHESATLVRAILTLARGLKLNVVAEGIETPGQHKILQRLGCPLGQGYLYARPLPAHEIHLTHHVPGQPPTRTGRSPKSCGQRGS